MPSSAPRKPPLKPLLLYINHIQGLFQLPYFQTTAAA